MDETLPPKKPVWTASTVRSDVQAGEGSLEEATPEWIGQYQVVKKLGAGSMGNVYRCHDQALGREVAVKVLKAQYAGDEHYRRRFRREARAVASLSHPCVVQVFSIHEDATGPQAATYIVMEFVDGCSADDFVAENGPVAVDLAAEWVRDAARGLREAAAKDIIHRDVKPSNILVTPAGAKIVDFGLAKELGAKNSLTQEGIVLGTPHYISPEQGRGRTLDHRADIYSLGATFYHLLTGRPPFDGDSQIAVIVAHVNEAPVAPHLERPEIPDSVTRVVFRMMAKSCDARYADYDELLEDLDALVEGREPPHATGSVEQLTPASSSPSRPRLKLVIPLALAVLVGGIALLALPPEREPPDLHGLLDTWCVSQNGYEVELDLDFRRPPGNDPLKLLQSVLTLPPGLPAGAERPNLRGDGSPLTWSEFSAPFAFAFSFERLEEAELWIADTTLDFDLAFSLVSPHGAQNRQFIFRLAPRQEKESPLFLAFERNQPVRPIETSFVRRFGSSGSEEEVPANPVLGAGPFALRFLLERLEETTRIMVTMEKLPRSASARSYRLTVVLPGNHWARGVPTLTTESVHPFSLSLDRAVFRGELAEKYSVTEVPWQR